MFARRDVSLAAVAGGEEARVAAGDPAAV